MSAKNHFTIEQARDIGDKLGIDWNRFDVEQFRSGGGGEWGVRPLKTYTRENDNFPPLIGLGPPPPSGLLITIPPPKKEGGGGGEGGGG